MRDINAPRNIAEIVDATSGDVHEIYYRMPSNSERVRYANSRIRRKGNKVQIRSDGFVLDLEFGEPLVTGFKKGTLGFDGEVFSSEPSDPEYRKDWKKLLVKHCPELVVAVARVAFSPALSRGAAEQSVVEFEDVETLDGEPGGGDDGGGEAGDSDGEEAGEAGDPLPQG